MGGIGRSKAPKGLAPRGCESTGWHQYDQSSTAAASSAVPAPILTSSLLDFLKNLQLYKWCKAEVAEKGPCTILINITFGAHRKIWTSAGLCIIGRG